MTKMCSFILSPSLRKNERVTEQELIQLPNVELQATYLYWRNFSPVSNSNIKRKYAMTKPTLQLTKSEEQTLESLKKHAPADSLSLEKIEHGFEEWSRSSKEDSSPKFELDYNGSSVFIDMLTLLQCLKIAEYTHHLPPLECGWWLKVIKQYPVEVNLDGRIQTKSE